MADLTKPYVLLWPVTPEQYEALDQMLRELYDAVQQRNPDGSARTDTPTHAQVMTRTVLGL